MNKYFKWLAFFALLAGFFFGKLPSASASPQISFAGYERSIPVTGVNAYIAYKNPPVPTGTSSEWVMVGNGVHYIQAGWLRLPPLPQHILVSISVQQYVGFSTEQYP